MPGILAKRVSSLPRPTFSPGKNFVPRCRTRIDPPVTSCPANAFTPSRCEFESRPLREEPCPFLCAMSALLLDRVDADLDHRLAVALGPPILLAPLFLEDQNLPRPHLRKDGRLNGQAFDFLGSLTRLTREDDVGKRQLLPLGDLLRRPLDPDDVARSHFELFSTRADDGVHEALQKRNGELWGFGAKSQGIGLKRRHFS